jgi:hypothetical protein
MYPARGHSAVLAVCLSMSYNRSTHIAELRLFHPNPHLQHLSPDQLSNSRLCPDLITFIEHKSRATESLEGIGHMSTFGGRRQTTITLQDK